MRGAGNARVVVPDALFTKPGQLVLRHGDVLHYDASQILFNRALILRCGRYNLCVGDHLLFANPVAVIENPSRRFRASETKPRPRHNIDRRLPGRLVTFDDAQGLLGCIECLNGTCDDTLERVSDRGKEIHLVRQFFGGWCEPLEVEVESGQRPDMVRSPFFQNRLQGVRIWNTLMSSPLFESSRPSLKGYSSGWRRATNS